MRLRLTLLSLKHLRGRPDGCALQVEGREHFIAALRSGKPVVVLGWHQGPVELLHQVPQANARIAEPSGTRPFFLMTAKAFAPALTRLMKGGRAGERKEILHPGSLAGLKRWEQGKGILALMTDQVPGKPEEWLAPLDGSVQVPFPGRLLDWIAERDAAFLIVSVRLEKRNRIVFRYAPTESRLLRDDMAFHLDNSLRAAPEQYNWSYPKIRFSTRELQSVFPDPGQAPLS
jgi:lauroyl/myristoyl acyltransferase